jgi:hypothetical protein
LPRPALQELVTEAPSIAEDAVQLMKFHGSYMQDNREQRTFGAGKSYQFMMRTRQPSGCVTNQLYLVMDELADLVSRRTAAGGQRSHQRTRGRAAGTPGAPVMPAADQAALRGACSGLFCSLLLHVPCCQTS